MRANGATPRTVLDVAFAHHVWATNRVIDACDALSEDELTRDFTSAGLFGSVLGTLRHLVESDAWYLEAVTGRADESPTRDEASLAELLVEMERHHEVWQAVVATAGDGTRVITQRGSQWTTTAPLAYRLAQALHHGTDHRSQVCTALTLCGREVPEIDLWDFGMVLGDITDSPTESAAG